MFLHDVLVIVGTPFLNFLIVRGSLFSDYSTDWSSNDFDSLMAVWLMRDPGYIPPVMVEWIVHPVKITFDLVRYSGYSVDIVEKQREERQHQTCYSWNNKFTITFFKSVMFDRISQFLSHLCVSHFVMFTSFLLDWYVLPVTESHYLYCAPSVIFNEGFVYMSPLLIPVRLCVHDLFNIQVLICSLICHGSLSCQENLNKFIPTQTPQCQWS